MPAFASSNFWVSRSACRSLPLAHLILHVRNCVEQSVFWDLVKRAALEAPDKHTTKERVTPAALEQLPPPTERWSSGLEELLQGGCRYIFGALSCLKAKSDRSRWQEHDSSSCGSARHSVRWYPEEDLCRKECFTSSGWRGEWWACLNGVSGAILKRSSFRTGASTSTTQRRPLIRVQ